MPVLALSRKLQESIVCLTATERIVFTVVRIIGHGTATKLRVCIEAPESVKIFRSELLERSEP